MSIWDKLQDKEETKELLERLKVRELKERKLSIGWYF